MSFILISLFVFGLTHSIFFSQCTPHNYSLSEFKAIGSCSQTIAWLCWSYPSFIIYSYIQSINRISIKAQNSKTTMFTCCSSKETTMFALIPSSKVLDSCATWHHLLVIVPILPPLRKQLFVWKDEWTLAYGQPASIVSFATLDNYDYGLYPTIYN